MCVPNCVHICSLRRGRPPIPRFWKRKQNELIACACVYARRRSSITLRRLFCFVHSSLHWVQQCVFLLLNIIYWAYNTSKGSKDCSIYWVFNTLDNICCEKTIYLILYLLFTEFIVNSILSIHFSFIFWRVFIR